MSVEVGGGWKIPFLGEAQVRPNPTINPPEGGPTPMSPDNAPFWLKLFDSVALETTGPLGAGRRDVWYSSEGGQLFHYSEDIPLSGKVHIFGIGPISITGDPASGSDYWRQTYNNGVNDYVNKRMYPDTIDK